MRLSHSRVPDSRMVSRSVSTERPFRLSSSTRPPSKRPFPAPFSRTRRLFHSSSSMAMALNRLPSSCRSRQPARQSLPAALSTPPAVRLVRLLRVKSSRSSGTGFGPAQPVVASFSNGVLPSVLSETRLLVDGNPAPLLSVSCEPVERDCAVLGSGKGMQSLSSSNTKDNAPRRFASVSGSPRRVSFTQNSSGTGPASALNQDGSANSASNPAAVGSVITLFGTGEGLSIPAGLDGRQITDVLPKPVQTVNATIGGVPATVDYAGGSSGTVAGLLQINVHIPAGVTPVRPYPCH